jgi:S1-C subfamily serine protease
MQKALLALMLLLGGQFTSSVQAQDSACIFAANQAATVHIEYKYVTNEGNGTETGSGFIVSPAGHVITNAHVVSPRLKDVKVQSATISVRTGGLFNPAVEARVVTRDQSVDLALLQLPQRSDGGVWPTVAVGSPVNLPVGARLIGLGFASAGDLAIVPTGEKTANNTVIDREVKPWWQTNLALNDGNSGSPIFGQLGTVVGIAVARRNAAQLVTYVIPIARAQHLLDVAEVRASQAGRCAVFPECRHASHGIERYAIDETKNKWSGFRGGGYDQGAFCNNFLAELQKQSPASTFTFVRSDEKSREVPIRHFEYSYFCEFRRRENPIYELKRSISCLK